MDKTFDFSRLSLLNNELGDDSESVRIDEEAIKQIQSPELRRRLAAIKLASRIMAIATANGSKSKGITHEALVSASSDFASRIGFFLNAGLTALGVEKGDKDHATSRLAMSRIAVDIAFSEWQWRAVQRQPLPPFDGQQMAALLHGVSKFMPERYLPDGDDEQSLPMARRTALLTCIVPLAGAFNYYDFFHDSADELLRKGLLAVADQAESMVIRMNPARETLYVMRALIARCYTTSVGLFVEAYKHVAQLVDYEISLLSVEEQAVQASYWRQMGGMSFDRVLIQHRQSVALAMDMMAKVLAISEQQATINGDGILDEF